MEDELDDELDELDAAELATELDWLDETSEDSMEDVSMTGECTMQYVVGLSSQPGTKYSVITYVPAGMDPSGKGRN